MQAARDKEADVPSAAKGRKKTTTVSALLVRAGEGGTEVVRIDPKDYTSMAKALGCQRVERWPLQHTLDAVDGGGGKKYRYVLWVDEEGACGPGRPDNVAASLAAHPLNEAYGRIVRGDALVVSADTRRKDLTMEDWENIVRGLMGEDEDLLDANGRGPSAYQVRVLRKSARSK